MRQVLKTKVLVPLPEGVNQKKADLLSAWAGATKSL
jgi:hypothetical protein